MDTLSDNIESNSQQKPRDSCYLEIQRLLDQNIGTNFRNIEKVFDDIHSRLNTNLCTPWSEWISN